MLSYCDVCGWRFEFSIDFRQWMIGFNFDKEHFYPWRFAPYFNFFLGPIRIGWWKLLNASLGEKSC